MRFFTILSLVSLAGFFVEAAPHKMIITKPGKQNTYLAQGQFRGGDAGRNFIFNDMRRAFSEQTGIERYILEFTGGNGEMLKNRPGFYQASIDARNGRVILEFSQVLGSRWNSTQLQKAFASSPYFKSSKMTYDPEDSGLTIQLFFKDNLKNEIEFEVFEVVSDEKGGRVAFDIRKKASGK